MEGAIEIDGRIGITQEWLVANGIATDGTLRKREQRQRIVALTRGGRGVLKVYEYKSMPEDMKRAVEAKMDVYGSAKRNMLEQYIEHDAEASRYYDDYTTKKGGHLPNTKERPIRRIYYTNAMVLRGIVRWKTAVEARGGRMDWEQVVQSVGSLSSMDYGCDLPMNGRKLREKVLQFEREGLESVIHKTYRMGSENATKVHKGAEEDMLVALIAEHRNFDCVEIAKLYNQWASSTEGHKAITASTVRVWQKKVRFITSASKHGAGAFSNGLTYQVKRRAPKAALSLWVLDGWDAELLYQAKRGKRTTYYNRLTVEVVLDAATKYPIGWAIGETESGSLIREALRNAERHVEELTGGMIRPYQIQCDNFARKAMMETYSGLAQYVTPAAAGNAKSKIIEPWFRTLNDKYCKYMPNWSGHGVTAKKSGQPNLDITLKRKEQLPTIEVLLEEVSSLLGVYRQQALGAYQEALSALPEGERVALSKREYLSLFGESTEQTYTLRGTGINVRIDGVPHQYDLLADPDDEAAMAEAVRFREQCWEKWSVLRDPIDPTHILVENADRTAQYMLTLKEEQPMALRDRRPGDYERLAAIWKFNHALSAHVAKTLSAHQASALSEVEGLREQRDYETLSKALIPDSRGQHKSERYAAERGLPSKAVEQIVEDIDPFEAAKQDDSEVMLSRF